MPERLLLWRRRQPPVEEEVEVAEGETVAEGDELPRPAGREEDGDDDAG